jgi:hypothetical protein
MALIVEQEAGQRPSDGGRFFSLNPAMAMTCQSGLNPNSEADRERTNRWFDGTLLSRQNKPGKTPIIIVMQRLHENDLTGHLQQRGGYRILALPMIAIEHESIQIGVDQFWERKPGDVIDPAHWSEEAIKEFKAARGNRVFMAQYQQMPLPAEGNLFRREWIKRFSDLPPRKKWEQTIQSWDIASGTSDHNDYSVCMTVMRYGNHTYVVDAWRGRFGSSGIAC